MKRIAIALFTLLLAAGALCGLAGSRPEPAHHAVQAVRAAPAAATIPVTTVASAAATKHAPAKHAPAKIAPAKHALAKAGHARRSTPAVPASNNNSNTGGAAVRHSAPARAHLTRTAYLKNMYAAVVPARERAAQAGHYVIGYNLRGLSCGTGCTGLFNGQARSSFDNAFFAMSGAYQRNTLAHEAAHAYGFLRFADYSAPSWARAGGWQAKFHQLDRGFARTYDAEAWAACVAWKETGFNNRVDQITSTCTSRAASLAMSQIRQLNSLA